MGWTAHQTPRNTLHVISDDDGSHFEALDEDEARENIAAIEEARAAKERAEAEAAAPSDELAVPAAVGRTGRLN